VTVRPGRSCRCVTPRDDALWGAQTAAPRRREPPVSPGQRGPRGDVQRICRRASLRLDRLVPIDSEIGNVILKRYSKRLSSRTASVARAGRCSRCSLCTSTLGKLTAHPAWLSDCLLASARMAAFRESFTPWAGGPLPGNHAFCTKGQAHPAGPRGASGLRGATYGCFMVIHDGTIVARSLVFTPRWGPSRILVKEER